MRKPEYGGLKAVSYTHLDVYKRQVKQIDGILALLASNTMAINDKIAGIISRLDRGEAIITANSLSRQDRRLDGGSNVAILGVGLLVITVVIGLIGFVAVRAGGAPAPYVIQGLSLIHI